MRLHPLCSWLLLALGVGCGGTPALNNQIVVRGLVLDAETGAAIAGAQVQTMPPTEQVLTDATGAFALTAQLGVRYQVQAAQDGFTLQSQSLTPTVGQDNELEFRLELVRVCTPDTRRCVQGEDSAGVQVCSARGNLWIDEPCADKQACDPANGTCRDLSNLFVLLDSPGGVLRSQPVEGQPGANINCGTACSADYFKGTVVTLVAIPLSQSTFTRWRSGMCAGTDPICEVTLNDDTRVAASFSATAFSLSVSTTGRGDGRVTSMPAGIDCDDSCSAVFDRDTMVTLTAAPAAGSTFSRWEQDCSDAGGGLTCTLTMDDAKNARARFVPEGIAVEVIKAGTGAGQVTSSPAGIDCGASCVSTFDEGSDVTLTANPAAGSNFVGWSGDCAGTDPTCVVTADAPRSATATFDGIARSLIVELGGGGSGRVSSTPAGIDCGANCQANFGDGSQVVLTASPDANQVFSGWALDCAGSGSAPDCTLDLDADRRARATFRPGYLVPLAEDADCAFILHLDTSAPNAVGCGMAPGTASVVGSYIDTVSRVTALNQARLAQGADEEGYIDVGRAVPAPSTATVELTLRKDGAAYSARGRAALVSDWDHSDPQTQGLQLSVMDDGRLVVSTRDGAGGTSTATSAVATIADGTWYHVAATVDSTSLALFVDGAEVVRTPGPVLWTASSSTAWVGAARQGPGGDAIYRFNGAMDEVRVSNVVRY